MENVIPLRYHWTNLKRRNIKLELKGISKNWLQKEQVLVRFLSRFRGLQISFQNDEKNFNNSE